MNPGPNDPVGTTEMRNIPWWITAKPSTATWIAVAIAYGVLRRRFEPQLIDALNWSRGQYSMVLTIVCAVMFAFGVMLDRWLKKKYGLSSPSKHRKSEQTGPSQSGPAAALLTRPDRRTERRS